MGGWIYQAVKMRWIACLSHCAPLSRCSHRWGIKSNRQEHSPEKAHPIVCDELFRGRAKKTVEQRLILLFWSPVSRVDATDLKGEYLEKIKYVSSNSFSRENHQSRWMRFITFIKCDYWRQFGPLATNDEKINSKIRLPPSTIGTREEIDS